MSTEIDAPITITPIAIGAPVTLAPVTIDAPVTIEPIVIEAPITLGAVGPMGPSVPVIDNLLSTSSEIALAANQGRVLDGKIIEVRTDYGNHETNFATQFQTMLS